MSEDGTQEIILNKSRSGMSNAQIAREIIILLLFGVFAAVMKEYIKTPMTLPGHEWMIWIALLVIGRAVSPFRWAGSAMGFGAAAFSFLPLFGPQEPFLALYFFIPALVFDLLYPLSLNQGKKSLLLIPIAGVTLLSKAVLQYGIYTIMGLPWKALKSGVYYPLLTHLAFGLAGGLTGFIILKYVELNRSSSKNKN